MPVRNDDNLHQRIAILVSCIAFFALLFAIDKPGSISDNHKPTPKKTKTQPIETQPIDDQIHFIRVEDKIRDWKRADYTSRITLCAGIAVVLNKGQRLKLSAVEYHNCIEEATRGLAQSDELTIMVVAALCDETMRRPN
jgi:hypothetical protein